MNSVDMYHQGHYCFLCTLEASPINNTITLNSAKGPPSTRRNWFPKKATPQFFSESQTAHCQHWWQTWKQQKRETEGLQASLLSLAAWLLLQISALTTQQKFLRRMGDFRPVHSLWSLSRFVSSNPSCLIVTSFSRGGRQLAMLPTWCTSLSSDFPSAFIWFLKVKYFVEHYVQNVLILFKTQQTKRLVMA